MIASFSLLPVAKLNLVISVNLLIAVDIRSPNTGIAAVNLVNGAFNAPMVSLAIDSFPIACALLSNCQRNKRTDYVSRREHF